MPKHDRPQAEVLRLKQQLELAQRQLYELEQGRLLRVYKYFRQSVVNPLWGVKNIGQLPGLFRRIQFPDTYGQSVTFRPSLRGDEQGSFMPYPNLKLATLGEVPDLSIYCHHLSTDESEWQRLNELGIDALLVGDTIGKSDADKQKLLKHFSDAGIPAFQLKEVDRPAIDLNRFNPMGLSDKQHSKPVGTYSQLSKPELYKFSAVRCRPEQFADERLHAETTLSILSCGIPVLTPKTKSLAGLLPEDFYFTDGDDKQISDQLTADIFSWKRASVKYRRHVHLNYSPRPLVDGLAKQLGFQAIDAKPTVSIIISSYRPEYVRQAIANAKSQSYPDKELLLILHGDDFDKTTVKKAVDELKFPVKLIERGSDTLFGDNLNLALDAAKGQYVTKMDDDDHYGPHHLEDLLAAYEYSRATMVGKRSNVTYLEGRDTVVTFSGGKEEQFGKHLPGATFLIRTDILRALRFGRVKKAIDSELFRRLETRGGTLYSTHSLNFIRVRHSRGHTYTTDDEDFIAHSVTKPVKGLKPEDYYS